ncbi:MAG TPA: YncE family protein, partial [Jatrophihabitans sp.]|nr:YncE family protein [Jatrophihabitans sp.]
MLSPAVRGDRPLVYVPNTNSNTVSVIDQRTMKVIATFAGGHEPQHVVPAYDLRTLYVAADYVPARGGPGDGSLTPIDPRTGTPGRPIKIDDPYNLYFTPDGRYGIVVAESRKRLDFYDPHRWIRLRSLPVPTCAGVDHMDFTADGRTLLASCEFADAVVEIDVASEKVVRTIHLPRMSNGMPQDVKLSPDGRVFYVADMMAD